MSDTLPEFHGPVAGRYTIERELGRGGMATVYLARDLKHDRPVALKVLRPELAAILGAERFLREIRLTAQLQHPHILTLIDSGEADGFLYYLMPFVEGESLRARLEREGQLALDETLRITRAVASALDFAHGHGVIHRDIKPENIMLHEGEPMVADFGIALAVSTAGRERLTETGLSLGTPAYMSPEQASAEPKLDGRTDQYSLACVVYEMLAGEPPYTGPTTQAIIAKRLTEPVPHLSTVRQVPAAVELAITRALSKSPADRFPASGAFASALSLPGTRRGTPQRLRLGLATGALVVGLGGSLWFINRSRPLDPTRVLVVGFANQTGDSTLSPVRELSEDWIAQAIARGGLVQVIRGRTPGITNSSDDIVRQARHAGAGKAIWGSYFRQHDSLSFHVQILDTQTGNVLLAPDPVTAPLTAPGTPTGEELGALASGAVAFLVDPRIDWVASSARPPKYAAYQEMVRGVELLSDASDPDAAATHFLRAWAIDSTFPMALLWASAARRFNGRFAQAESILHIVDARRERMGAYDRAEYDWESAVFRHDAEASYRAGREMMQLAPTQGDAIRSLLDPALFTNRPREVLSTLSSYTRSIRFLDDRAHYAARAYHLLRDHRRELEAVRAARKEQPTNGLLKLDEAIALAGLGLTAEVPPLLDSLLVSPPRAYSPGTVARAIGRELRAHGQPVAARAAFGQAIVWYQGRLRQQAVSVADRDGLAWTLYAAERWDEARQLFERLVAEFPDSVAYRGVLGALAVRRGDATAAAAVEHGLARLARPYLFGIHTLWRARITALLGDRDRTLALLQDALRQGGLSVEEVHLLAEFESLRGYPPFEDLMRPRG